MASKKLSALKVRNLTEPGRYGDGDGLWLQVRDGAHRSWLLRYAWGGRLRLMGLGAYPAVSLAEAREAATAARKLIRAGLDPIEERQKAKAAQRDAAGAITFAEVAKRYIAAHEAVWRNEKHRYQWRATLDTASATIGKRPVANVDTSDVMKVLEPIWTEKPETASRLRGRIEAVLDYAAARGWRKGENPARWRGHLAKLLPAPGKIARVQHHPALPYAEVAAFMAVLRAEGSMAALALEYTVLTAARTGEVIGATWGEIDIQAAVWTVPAERMKAGREHRVPLTEAALDVLRKAARLRRTSDAGEYVFPGMKDGKPMSNMAMNMLLRRMERTDLTVHGFRSTFRDWAAEATAHPREVAEQALAHSLSDKVEAAYRRGDLFEKRRRLMDDWAAYCARPALPADIVPIRGKAAGEAAA